MTAQVGSIYKYEDKHYTIVAKEGNMEFSPYQYGFMPAMVCTACWAGYWCQYDIRKDGIYLDTLYINDENNNYPDINGVSVKKGYDEIDSMGHHCYEHLNLKMHDFTGKILAGNDFMYEYYIHMGFQSFYSYKKLLEFVFKEGKLLEVKDHSEYASRYREGLNKTISEPVAGKIESYWWENKGLSWW